MRVMTNKFAICSILCMHSLGDWAGIDLFFTLIFPFSSAYTVLLA